MRLNHIVIVIALSIALILPLYFGLKIFLSIKEHNLNLKNYEETFSTVPHPSQSILLLKYSSVGLLVGNSNHCDYFVGEVRQTTLSEVEIMSFYKNILIQGPGAVTNEKCEINIEFYKNGCLPQNSLVPIQYTRVPESIFAKSDHTATLYLIYSLDAGYAPDYDPRCY